MSFCPALVAAFSPALARWRGTATREASTIWPEPLEIHRINQRFQRIAIRQNLLQKLLDVPKSRLLRNRGILCC